MDMNCKKSETSPLWYYISEKKEDAVLFIHSAFADHTQYDSQINAFSNYFTVITLDLIGHGKSTNVKKGDSIDKTAEWIKAILDQEKIKKIHLVGISIGAVLAADFANRYPEMVKSLACFGGYDINNFDVKAQNKNQMTQLMMMLKAIFSIKWFAKSNKLISAYTPEAQEAFYQMNIRFPKKSFMYLSGLNKLINKYASVERNYPLLIGCGEKDIPMELKLIEMWHEREPKSEVVVFKGAGHLVNMDTPTEFNKVVMDFIHRADERQAAFADKGVMQQHEDHLA